MDYMTKLDDILDIIGIKTKPKPVEVKQEENCLKGWVKANRDRSMGQLSAAAGGGDLSRSGSHSKLSKSGSGPSMRATAGRTKAASGATSGVVDPALVDRATDVGEETTKTPDVADYISCSEVDVKPNTLLFTAKTLSKLNTADVTTAPATDDVTTTQQSQGCSDVLCSPDSGLLSNYCSSEGGESKDQLSESGSTTATEDGTVLLADIRWTANSAEIAADSELLAAAEQLTDLNTPEISQKQATDIANSLSNTNTETPLPKHGSGVTEVTTAAERSDSPVTCQ